MLLVASTSTVIVAGVAVILLVVIVGGFVRRARAEGVKSALEHEVKNPSGPGTGPGL